MELTALGRLLLGVLLAEPVSRSLARAHWPVRDRVGGLLVWQAVGLSGGLALLGSGVVYGLAPLGPSLPAAFRALDPAALRLLGPTHVAALAAALLLGLRLVGVLGAITVRTLRA